MIFKIILIKINKLTIDNNLWLNNCVTKYTIGAYIIIILIFFTIIFIAPISFFKYKYIKKLISIVIY